MSTVKLTGIKKIYDNKVTAVHDVNLEIADNEFIVLVGPSGCGKSTTLRMVAGLEEISDGTLEIDGKVVNDLTPKDRDIAMVFQSYALYPHMTVYGNMAFPLKMRKMNKDEIDKRVKAAAETLGITQYLDRKPKALSGGQRQRVAIGRAIVREPKVLLMDEPLSNLDAKLRNQMRAEIIKLRQRINTTFIYVTHDQTEAMTLGDRIVIMKDGYVNQIGTPQELFNCPVNTFVAGFIGTPQMNFFNDEKLLLKDGKYSITVQGVEIALDDKQNAALADINAQPTDIIVGVRPEHINVGEGQLTATVDVSEMMGSSLHLHATANGNNLVMVVPTLGMDDLIQSGAEIKFSFGTKSIQIFDKETGNSLFWYDPVSAAANAPKCKPYLHVGD
jgi:multiple sugar transport system ATP-binding protein